MDTRTGRRGHLMRHRRYSGAARAVIEDPAFAEDMEMLVDHLHRRAEGVSHDAHPLRTMQDYTDYAHILMDVTAQGIAENGVTHALFFDVPHMGYDTACFLAARAMDIPCTILGQSLFPGRFWSMRDPAHLGGFDSDTAAEAFPIERGEDLDLFYMGGIRQDRGKGGRLTAASVAQMTAFLIRHGRWRALNPLYVVGLLRRMRDLQGRFPRWRDPFARFFHEDSLAYFDHLAGFEDGAVDLDGPYVYVPLQMQPEMTTSSLGGPFRDQALAIEHLSEIVPPGIRILVKENPKQGAYMRGPLFWHRLRRIPSVTVLPSWADTKALTARAGAVATITGTVGWEAIREGIPAIAFGRAWWRRLPGAIEWRDDLTWDDVVDLRWDHGDLERAVGAFLARTHDGVVLRHYAKMLADFDPDANADRVADAVHGLLREVIEPTFDRP
ncbi:hypothetical protein [Jannaschia sp. LMIT008]|uniref:capsular polysaccharide export protein, LipB/KpsS family n=1 Tax=Jannaschia maritima TaxID=3032585 RepID=UPI0028115CB6|nr:hypothetical protein [Jannaschia sp. LMIT008]